MKLYTQPTDPTIRHPLKAMWHISPAPVIRDGRLGNHGDARCSSRLRSLFLVGLAICLGASFLLSGCAQTVAPKEIVSTQASIDPTGQNSGIVAFYKDHITVSQHWLDRYHMMVNLNAQKPDMVSNKPNPDKVFIVGKEDAGIKLRPDGNYDAPYTTLFYFDRLDAAFKKNRKS
jgi:hypothetical protein